VKGTSQAASSLEREVDKKIEQKVGSQFDDILGDLKDLGAQEAALKWRVLGMMVSQRRKEEDVRVDGILKYRMRVSGLLIGAVEDLAEDESLLDKHDAALP
jgi:hypothetical protein